MTHSGIPEEKPNASLHFNYFLIHEQKNRGTNKLSRRATDCCSLHARRAEVRIGKASRRIIDLVDAVEELFCFLCGFLSFCLALARQKSDPENSVSSPRL